MTQMIKQTRSLLILLAGILLVILLTGSNAYAAEEHGVTENGLHYDMGVDGEYTIAYYSGTDSIVRIPETIDGIPVTAVGEAFLDNSIITEVVFPETVTQVYARCFENCSNLRKLHLGGVKQIIPEVHRVYQVIDHCPQLETLTFGPDAGLKIRDEGQAGYYREFYLLDIDTWNNLKHIAISANMDTVSESFFYGKSLETIEIGSGHPQFSSIDGILYSADGKNLLVCGSGYPAASYVIPEGVTTLGHIGFDSCSNLRTITIPRSVTTVNHAFANISPTLYVYKGSAAEEYAAKYGMDYRRYNESDVLETPVTKITLSQTEAAMKVGETLQLTAVCTPYDADDQRIEWDSVFNGIAEVSADGLVTAKNSGTALITASALGGYDVKETCRIEVTGEASEPEQPMNPDPAEPTEPTEPSVPADPTDPNPSEPSEPSPEDPDPTDPEAPPAVQKAQHIAGASAFTKTYGSKAFSLGASARTKLTYKSANSKIAAVNAKGLVTLKAPGRTTITITAAATKTYKAATKKVTITVKPKQMVAPKVKVSKSRTLTVSWKKDANVTGYQVIIAQNSKFTKGRKTANITRNTTGSISFKKLAKGKTYYAKVRAYKKVGTTKLYGSYSKIKKMKVK